MALVAQQTRKRVEEKDRELVPQLEKQSLSLGGGLSMTPREAALRVMQEIVAFTDRPDYAAPTGYTRLWMFSVRHMGL